MIRGALAFLALLLALCGGRIDAASATDTRQPLRRRAGPFRQALDVEFGPVWQTKNRAAVPGNAGTRFDLDDVTGAGPFAYGRATLDWSLGGRHHLRLLAAPLTIQERGTLGAAVRFRGKTFPAGPVHATFRFDSYRLTYRYLLARGRTTSWFVGATAKVRSAEIGLRQGSLHAVKSNVGFVPLLHADMAWDFAPRWRLTADLDLAAAPQGRAIDFALKLHRRLTPRWGVALGYRTIEGGADNDAAYTFTWLHQATVSVTYRW